MRIEQVAALALVWASSAGAQELQVELSGPAELTLGQASAVLARVQNAAQWPLLITPHTEGGAVEVVRGRMLRGEAIDPHAEVLEFRIPIVARSEGTAVFRVAVAGYICAARCRQTIAEASIVLRVSAGPHEKGKQSAEPQRSSLSWVRLDGAEECAASTELARAVEERLGRSVFVSASDAQITVEGRAERSSDGFRGVIHVSDAHGEALGERIVESHSASCQELDSLVAIAIAIMIDPFTTVPPPPPLPPTETRTIVIEHPAPRWRVEIDASLVGSLASLPTATLGGLSAIIVTPPGFVPLVLEGALFPFARAEPAAGHADFMQVQAGLQICPLAIGDTQFSLHACLGADAGAMIVYGGDLTVPDRERIIGQAHAAVRGHFYVNEWLVIRAGLHFLVPFRHDSFAYLDPMSNVRAFYVPEPVAAMLDLGLGARFE